jgi:hypothetical protein
MKEIIKVLLMDDEPTVLAASATFVGKQEGVEFLIDTIRRVTESG